MFFSGVISFGKLHPTFRQLGLLLPVLTATMALAACDNMVWPISQRGALAEGRFKPIIAPQTHADVALRSLPPPTRRINVAVYDFPDLTGQFKDSDTIQTLSKAVTQGGASMLIKALEDAGDSRWFTVLDRAALNDLLKERQIITEMRKEYRGEDNVNPQVLPPIADAGIILEGGIIGYDTNTETGGAGANFLGIGGDTKWTQDTITVTLRAVSTKSSEVLASVTVNKVLDSVALDGNVFLYVEMDKLLQGEGGYTQNEPKQIAVQEAIDKAVRSLIIEGAKLKIWSFADRTAGSALIAEYDAEKYGDMVSFSAANPPPTATPDAAYIAQTHPIDFIKSTKTPAATTVRTYPAPSEGALPGAGTSSAPPPPEGKDGEPLG